MFRDPRMKGLVFIAPIIQLVLFGYAVNTEDTVQIHFNTCLAAMEILGR